MCERSRFTTRTVISPNEIPSGYHHPAAKFDTAQPHLDRPLLVEFAIDRIDVESLLSDDWIIESSHPWRWARESWSLGSSATEALGVVEGL